MTEEGTNISSEDRPARRRPRSREEDDRSVLHRYGKRVLVFLGGLILVVGGAIMLVTPGPGLVAIFAGMAVWATEFEWAERQLDRLKDRFDAVARKAGVDPKKAAIGGILALIVLGVAATVLWFVLT